MIVDLKPYPEVRDPGVQWLGKVPKHWEVRRLKHAFRIVGGSTPSSAEAGYWDGDVLWITPADVRRVERLKGSIRRITYEGLNACSAELVPPGSIILTSRAPVGNVALAEAELCTSQGCKALIPTGRIVNSLFALHALKTLKNELQSLATGTTFTEIDGRRLGAVAMPVPPLAEQAEIVRFLDHADRRIRRYIRAKRKLIKLLEEQKQVIIHRAVTRGLDPNVRLKPSGVEWLGDVPEHWSVASLRFRYSQCLGKMVDSKSITGKHLTPYLRNVDVRWDKINTLDLPLIDIKPEEQERFTVQPGDLLVCEGRHLGRSAFWKGEIVTCGFQKALHRLRAISLDTDYPRFLYHCLYLAHIRDAFAASSFDNSIPHLTGEMLRAHKFPFPPLQEQIAIATYLDDSVANLEKAGSDIKRENSLFRDYRTRLIADVVTGKLDVREAAARLPDEDEQPEPLDEDLGGPEDATADELDAAPEEAGA